MMESSSGDSDASLSDFSLFDSPNTKKLKERKCKREFLAKTVPNPSRLGYPDEYAQVQILKNTFEIVFFFVWEDFLF